CSAFFLLCDGALRALHAFPTRRSSDLVTSEIEIAEAKRARAAAYVITAAEGGALHLARLRERARDFDPAVRDRLIAGAMIPAAQDRKSTRLNSSHVAISYAVFCLKNKN